MILYNYIHILFEIKYKYKTILFNIKKLHLKYICVYVILTFIFIYLAHITIHFIFLQLLLPFYMLIDICTKKKQKTILFLALSFC